MGTLLNNNIFCIVLFIVFSVLTVFTIINTINYYRLTNDGYREVISKRTAWTFFALNLTGAILCGIVCIYFVFLFIWNRRNNLLIDASVKIATINPTLTTAQSAAIAAIMDPAVVLEASPAAVAAAIPEVAAVTDPTLRILDPASTTIETYFKSPTPVSVSNPKPVISERKPNVQVIDGVNIYHKGKIIPANDEISQQVSNIVRSVKSIL